MIISFSIENWMSFRDSVSFSMVASRERQHRERVPKITKYQTRIVPIAAIYGGNASGKTNFFKALNFVKQLVVRGAGPDSYIPVDTFQLDDNTVDKPSRFKLELLIDEIIYEFSFAVTRKMVIEEKLVKITSTSEKTLYDRQGDKPNFDPSLKDDQHLLFAYKGTRSNQLFLTNSISQQIDTFRPVYDWFKDTLVLKAPDSRFVSFEHSLDEDPSPTTLNEIMTNLDTGISRLGGDEFSFENIPIPEILKRKIKEEIKEGTTIRLVSSLNERFIITQKSGELVTKKLVTFHPRSDGTEAKFDIQKESDGTQRMIDLLPAFLDVLSLHLKKVYVIDEFDRSLHTLLTRELIEAYLENCSALSRTQLLITTHDVLLMDQGLFRRDELWVAERNHNGSSQLIPFSNYKDVRYDKDIRKSYLEGRLGGVPRILMGSELAHQREND